jgi:hypothetical protein
MKRTSLSFCFFLISAICAHADEIAVWNFNDGTLNVSRATRTATLTTSFNSGDVSFSSGSTVNARGGDPAGQALELEDKANNGRDLTWFVSTQGYSSIRVSFAVRGTSTGFNSNAFLYTVDGGVSWLTFSSFTPSSAFATQAFDLSGIAALNDNPLAGFRVVFNGATSATGNNRIDNLVVEGQLDPSPVAVPELATLLLFGTGMMGAISVKRFRKII